MKRYFCENCGSQLTSDDRYCENCGYPVSADIMEIKQKSIDFSTGFSSGFKSMKRKDTSAQTLNIEDEDIIFFFSHEGWEKCWGDAARQYGNENLGIIIINRNESLKRYCEEIQPLYSEFYNDFIQSLKKYIGFRREYGIFYFVLDMNSQIVLTRGCTSVSSENIVNILKKIYRVAKPKYLLLVGDEEVIGSVKWENETYVAPDPLAMSFGVEGDSDRFVDSDLPYLTLDMKSPWSGQEWQNYTFESCVRVGRIPCHTIDGYAGAVAYFENAINLGSTQQDLKSFALSAQTWEKTSKTIYRPLGREVYTSPNKTAEDFMAGALKDFCGGREPNLLFFNLHGSPDVNYWIGEGEVGITKAFTSNCLPSKGIGYVIGTEACYGAKPADVGSMLFTAFQNGCVAFLGSTQIAYGLGNGECFCADILVGEWIKKVAEQYTVGDAYVAALKQLCQNELDLEEIKTLAEFSLYGDPSLSLFSAKPSVLKSFNPKSLPLQKGIHIPMPDIRKAVSLKLTKVNEAIEAKLKQYIERDYKDFVGTTPYFCELRGRNGYQATYSKNLGFISKIMKVYFDKNGNIGKVYISK